MQYRSPTESRGARLAQLIDEFRDHRIPSPHDSRILFGSERHSFTGNARDLNRFLGLIAELPETRGIKIVFIGPEGDMFGDPLTASAAQTCADYDWRVQIFQGDVTVSIPLAKDIPFAQIAVPSTVTVEAGSEAPRIASLFAKLHGHENQERPDTESK